MATANSVSTNSFCYTGFGYYSLTWRCFARHTLSTQQDRFELVRAQFLRASEDTKVINVAYCFMTDHVHQLVKGDAPDADVKQYIRRAKQYSGFYFKQVFQVKLWERDGFNRVLLGDYEPQIAARYIVENPVRAGLVRKAEDYPFTGSQIYTMKQLMEWAYAV
jgi:putative transposase